MAVAEIEGISAREKTDFIALKRYLILGIQDSFYTTEKEALQSFILLVHELMSTDAELVVTTIMNTRHKAPKPNACVIALAVACAHPQQQIAWDALGYVVTNGSQMMLFVRVLKELRGWGRRPRRRIGAWYRGHMSLGLDLVKYQNRTWLEKSMSQKYIIERVHKRYFQNDELYAYVVDGVLPTSTDRNAQIIRVVHELPSMTQAQVIEQIVTYRLPWEVIPTAVRTKAVWEAIVPHMGAVAFLRNMAVFAVHEVEPRLILNRLASLSEHPINILIAWYIYRQGYGYRSVATWTPNDDIVAALEALFYRSFGELETSNVKSMIALDVSSSMTHNSLNGIAGLTPRVIAAVMAMVTVRTQPNARVVAFSTQLVDFEMSSDMRLEAVVRKMADTLFGATITSLPMRKIINETLDIDALLLYTDMETGAEDEGVLESLMTRYRSDHPLKYVQVAMVPNDLTVSYTKDDAYFSGFSADLPQNISAFLTL